VEIDDRAGGTVRMPGNPWIFSRSELPQPGLPAFQGEHNEEILTERDIAREKIDDLQKRKILLSRRGAFGAFD
jgi:crotonobetainyl-CoA:carnitine CoA-transferase CaiB-like acyl-CoA transferase